MTGPSKTKSTNPSSRKYSHGTDHTSGLEMNVCMRTSLWQYVNAMTMIWQYDTEMPTCNGQYFDIIFVFLMWESYGYSDVGEIVGDVKNRSPKSRSYHQHKSSPTSFTSIDIAESYLHAWGRWHRKMEKRISCVEWLPSIPCRSIFYQSSNPWYIIFVKF